uniref:Uncharacterized protein LOC104239225 n=1 Tax=Nicotiana sylvestris TaxID=4096 RepID=A0A1U7XYS3_NICSY|nr:PREDICTED: uncharacterized protein LOC104239225 [Nicotiana sylvestris]
MVEDFLEVFMDDFSVVGDSFEHCLHNLRHVLKRCEETNLVLNWEKCHFVVDEGIMLGHKISKHDIEVDRAKIEIISKLPPPTSVKGFRSFLGHAGFYRRFIKDFSKIANPVCKLLEKDATLEEAGRPKGDLEINDAFPDEHILALSSTFAPWHADIANYLVSDLIPDGLESYQKKKFLRDCRQYYWEEPFLFRVCADNIIRRCVPEEEIMPILKACHDSPVGGYHGGNRTADKVLECGYYWPSIYHDANQMVKACDKCQRQGSISKRHEMPMHFVMDIEIFDMWGIYFIGPFVSSCGMKYILVAVDYVSKWVETIALPNNEVRSVTTFLKKNIFTRFGTPRAILSDGGSHFCNKAFMGLLEKYGIKHKLATPYHQQSSG